MILNKAFSGLISLATIFSFHVAFRIWSMTASSLLRTAKR